MRSIFSANLKCAECGSDLDSEIKPDSNGYESKVILLVKPCEVCNLQNEELKKVLTKFLA